MGRATRSGFGYGMNEREAQSDFMDTLNRQYGEGGYQGGGNDICEWLDSKCEQEPVPASAPSKTKFVKVAARAEGKLVNGFLITTETPKLIRQQSRAIFGNRAPVPEVIESFALTQGSAKQIANDMAIKHSTPVHVLPARLWQDNRTKRLSLPPRIAEVTPIGGKEAEPGKWQFNVEVLG
ncbi:hypothetical protein [Cohnella soli]|uniref:Uncharacterized protein n=1 Tax=Cohnella soli TaxID=425005 RepID=A0ABW0HMM5_9BACL